MIQLTIAGQIAGPRFIVICKLYLIRRIPMKEIIAETIMAGIALVMLTTGLAFFITIFVACCSGWI